MGRDLVLITGVTGFIGFRVLVRTLQAGFAVRCTVRSSAGIKKVLSTPSIRALQLTTKQLYWTFVSDLSAPGAYDEAVKGVKYVIHCGVPMPAKGGDVPPPDQQEAAYIRPTVDSITGLLDSVARCSSPHTVKRIVVTSSLVAVVPAGFFHGTVDPDTAAAAAVTPFDADHRLPTPVAPYSSGFGPYAASRIAALNATEAWVEQHNPSFDVVSILPSWVWGRNELAGSLKELMRGSCGLLVEQLGGTKVGLPFNDSFVSIHDVADAHVLALRPEVRGNQAFLLSSTVSWDVVEKVMQEKAAAAAAAGVQDCVVDYKRSLPIVHMPVDAGKAEKELGIKFRNFEETLREVKDQYLELAELAE